VVLDRPVLVTATVSTLLDIIILNARHPAAAGSLCGVASRCTFGRLSAGGKPCVIEAWREGAHLAGMTLPLCRPAVSWQATAGHPLVRVLLSSSVADDDEIVHRTGLQPAGTDLSDDA
jgi:hypothetical protein